MQKLKPDFEEVSPLKMIPLSLKLNPTVLDNMEAVRARIRQNRNTYINLAIDVYNHYHRYSMMKKLVEGEIIPTTYNWLLLCKPTILIKYAHILILCVYLKYEI